MLCCVFLVLSVLEKKASEATFLCALLGKMIRGRGWMGGGGRAIDPRAPCLGLTHSGVPLSTSSGWRGKNSATGLGIPPSRSSVTLGGSPSESDPKGRRAWEVVLGCAW